MLFYQLSTTLNTADFSQMVPRMLFKHLLLPLLLLGVPQVAGVTTASGRRTRSAPARGQTSLCSVDIGISKSWKCLSEMQNTWEQTLSCRAADKLEMRNHEENKPNYCSSEAGREAKNTRYTWLGHDGMQRRLTWRILGSI